MTGDGRTDAYLKDGDCREIEKLRVEIEALRADLLAPSFGGAGAPQVVLEHVLNDPAMRHSLICCRAPVPSVSL